MASNSLGDTIIHSEKTLQASSAQEGQKWCQVIILGCSVWGTADPGSLEPYDPNKSTLFELDLNYHLKATAELFVDVFTIGGKVIPKVPFGIPTSSNLESNILGLGFADNEAAPDKYLNLPQVIKENKLTKINAYSLWLNKGERDGQIVFGGYDQSKHSGHFAHLKVQTINGRYTEAFVPVKSASFGKAKKTLLTTSLAAATLDLGSPLTLLPRDFAMAVGKAVGAEIDDSDHFIIDCDLSPEVAQMYIVFDFGSVKITLLAEDVVLPQGVSGTPAGKCFWGISPTDDHQLIFGSNFLRRAYVVFDLDHKIVSIAQSAYTGDSKGYEIPAEGLQALGDLLGQGDPDPELERIAGSTETGDEVAENPDMIFGNDSGGALNTGIGASGSSTEDTQTTPGGATNLPSNAVGTEPSNSEGSNDQATSYSYLPETNTFLGTLGAGTQQDKPLVQMASNDASAFDSNESGKFTAQLPSLFSGTEVSAEKGLTNQQQPEGEYSPATANALALGTNRETSTTTANKDENLNTWHDSAASNLFPTYPATPAGGDGSESPTTKSNLAVFPAAAGTSANDYSQGPSVNLASSFTPGEGGENLFLDTNTA